MAAFGETHVHDARVVGAEDGTIGSSVELGSFGGCGGQGGDGSLSASGDKLGVSEGLVVAHITEELGSILEEQGGLGLFNAGLVAQRSPVATRGFVEGNDQVIYGLRLGRVLAQTNPGTSKGSPVTRGATVLANATAEREQGQMKETSDGRHLLADKVSIALLLVGQGLKVRLNLEPDNRGRVVGEEVGEFLGVHGGG